MRVSESEDVPIRVDRDTAVVLMDWLDREARIDDFKWAAARPGDRVALQRLREALRRSGLQAEDAKQARSRLESTLPLARRPVPDMILQRMPEAVKRRIMVPPDRDLLGRLGNRLDMLGVRHTGVGWQVENDRWFVEIGLDPYSDDVANRIRLICEPIEVRFIRGPTRPRWPFPGPGISSDLQ